MIETDYSYFETVETVGTDVVPLDVAKRDLGILDPAQDADGADATARIVSRRRVAAASSANRGGRQN